MVWSKPDAGRALGALERRAELGTGQQRRAAAGCARDAQGCAGGQARGRSGAADGPADDGSRARGLGAEGKAGRQTFVAHRHGAPRRLLPKSRAGRRAKVEGDPFLFSPPCLVSCPLAARRELQAGVTAAASRARRAPVPRPAASVGRPVVVSHHAAFCDRAAAAAAQPSSIIGTTAATRAATASQRSGVVGPPATGQLVRGTCARAPRPVTRVTAAAGRRGRRGRASEQRRTPARCRLFAPAGRPASCFGSRAESSETGGPATAWRDDDAGGDGENDAVGGRLAAGMTTLVSGVSARPRTPWSAAGGGAQTVGISSAGAHGPSSISIIGRAHQLG